MKCPRLGLTFLVAMLLAPVLGSGLTRGDAATDQTFTGRVYDLDYLSPQGWTQVLVRATGGDSNLVATTQDDALQQVLETALLNATEVQLTYRAGQPAELQRVLLRSLTGCSEKGCVEEVGCSTADAICIAHIKGQPTEVTTNNPRALGILLTAISKKKAVEYLDVDQKRNIVRVKINVP